MTKLSERRVVEVAEHSAIVVGTEQADHTVRIITGFRDGSAPVAMEEDVV